MDGTLGPTSGGDINRIQSRNNIHTRCTTNNDQTPTSKSESTNTDASDQPPRDESKFESRIRSIVTRTAKLIRTAAESSYAYAQAHPRYLALLLAACGVGFLYGRWQGKFSQPIRTTRITAATNLPSFQLPSWTDSPERKEFAGIVHLLSLAMALMRSGREYHPIGKKGLATLPTGLFPPNITPMQLMERLRSHLNDTTVLEVIASQLDSSLLVEPLIEMACNPAIPPFAQKYAAVCLDRLCTQPDGRLCKIIAQHSNHDLLVALSSYTDFQAWNYLYLLQMNPDLIALAEQLTPESEGTAASARDLPAYLRPFYVSHPPNEPGKVPTEEQRLSLNEDTSPVATFLSKHLQPSPGPSASAMHAHGELSPDARDLIDLLLSLPPVQTRNQDSPVGVLQHALSTGAAQRERGSGLVTVAREMGKDVVQQGAVLAAAFRSSLAENDLALLRQFSSNGSSSGTNRFVPEDDSFVERSKSLARQARRQVSTALHSVLSRRPGYKLGHAAAHDRRQARKQEVSYHAFRALATLSQDATTASHIVEAGGVDLLYRVYLQYPHELRVQIQVARALANLLEHAHAPSHRHLSVNDDDLQPDVRFATYHAVARSGFLPMLVHWTQHALNYTDAPPSTTKVMSKGKKERSPEKREKTLVRGHHTPTAAAVNPTTSQSGSVSISTSDPGQRERQANFLASVQSVKHANDEDASPAVPPPVGATPDASSPPSSNSVANDGLLHTDSDLHPLRQPHHPESAASLRNKLQLQSARALINMRSIMAYKHLSEHKEDRQDWIDQHGPVSFPILADEVYQFYPLVDTLHPPTDAGVKQSSAQKNSRKASRKRKSELPSPSGSSSAAPLSPPQPEYDFVFLHGLMGNPLRTWRLHSMHDRTIGWIPSTPEEKLRAGLPPAPNASLVPLADVPISGVKTQPSLTPLERHLSNIVSSGPLPIEAGSPNTTIQSIQFPTDAEAEAIPIEPTQEIAFDPSPAAAPMQKANTLAALALPAHAPIHSSQHSLDFETLWPRDWLPSAFPQARILSLGYYTGLSMKTTGEMHSKSIEDRARELAEKMDQAGIGKHGRKVIWVTHSMGGLLVKKILLHIEQAERNAAFRGAEPSSARYSEMLDNTVGVVFYSTPHNGTWLPVLSQEGLFTYVMIPSHELMDLQNQSNLRAMNEDFKREIIDGRGVSSLSFGEGIGTPLLHLNRTTQKIINWKFVPVDSSRPGFGKYLYFPTQNHLTICKPKTELDENYSALTTFLRQAIETDARGRRRAQDA